MRHAAAAEPEVGPLARVEAIAFRGNTAFTAAQIRSGLMSSFEFLLAAHPWAGRSNYLATLPELMVRGYRCAGYPDVKATARVPATGSGIMVEIVEGPRLVQGEILFRGAKTIPVAALRHELTNSVKKSSGQPLGGADVSATDASARFLDSEGREINPREAIWQPGEPFPFSQPLGNYAQSVEQTLTDFGYFFPKVEVSVVRHDDRGTADLLVSIIEEGPHGTVKEIVVTGVTNNSRAQILQFLGLREGMPIERELISGCERRLWESARFLRYSVTPLPLPQDTNAIRLTVDVQELSGTPALGREFSREERAMLKFRDWLLLAMRTNDLVVSAAASNSAGLAQAIRIVISPHGIAAWLLPELTAGLSNASSVFLADGRDFTAFSPRTGRKFSTPFTTNQIFQFNAALLPDRSEDREESVQLTVGAGFAPREKLEALDGASPMRLKLIFAPCAFVREAHRTNGLKWIGNTLSMTTESGEIELRIDGTTGQLLRFSGRSTDELVGLVTFDIAFQPGAHARATQELAALAAGRPNHFESRRAISTSADFVVQELLDSPLVHRWLWKELDAPTRPRAGAALNALLQAGALGAFDAFANNWPQAGDTVFYVPPKDPANVPQMMETLAAMVAARVFQLADTSFPRQSWPWVVAREAVFVFAGKPVFTERELGRLYESEDVGPVGFLALSKLLNAARMSAGQAFAMRGLDRLTLNDFRKDSRLLLEANTAAAESFTNTVQGMRALSGPDLEALIALAPRSLGPFLRNVARPSRAETKPLPAATGALLDELWRSSLRTEIARALRASAGQAIEIAAAEGPLAEGWKYFEGKEVPQDHARAVKLFREAAGHKHPCAEFMLGTCYEQGLGVGRDLKQAAQWYRRAAEQGVAEAQAKLGDWLSDDFTLPTDYEEAYVWLSLAAMQGDLVSGSRSRAVLRKLTPEQLEKATKRLAPLAEKSLSLTPKAK